MELKYKCGHAESKEFPHYILEYFSKEDGGRERYKDYLESDICYGCFVLKKGVTLQ